MSKQPPPLLITDLLRSHKDSLANIVGRDKEMARMARLIQRRQDNNLIVVGKRGVGKTSLIQGFIRRISENKYKSLPSLPYLQLDTAWAAGFLQESVHKEMAVEHMQAAFQSLPPVVFMIDDADWVVGCLEDVWQFEQIFLPFTNSVDRHLVLVLEEEKWEDVKERYNRAFKSFDILMLTELPESVCRRILLDRASRTARSYGIRMLREAVDVVLEYGRQLPSERAMPDRALRFFDESGAACKLNNEIILTVERVQQVYADRIGIPSHNLNKKDLSRLRNLGAVLEEQVVGQRSTVKLVAQAIQRGWLGLKNPNRPVGSFLFLGPSGVGKTELTKTLAREIYGTAKAMVRIDMSEFAEPHTVQRLLGAPPGYVGYEAGGQLTNPVLEKPHSLVLLDEIEKAHPSVFDIFLQVLDDGRLTDGRGQTVDFKNTIVIATSNIGINEIVDFWRQGYDIEGEKFKQVNLMPLLTKIFRLEFLNRFEGVSVFNPLSEHALFNIAKLEIKKIEKRFARYNVKIEIPEDLLRRKVAELSDPRFGARPLKRYIEQTCESLLAEQLLNSTKI